MAYYFWATLYSERKAGSENSKLFSMHNWTLYEAVCKKIIGPSVLFFIIKLYAVRDIDQDTGILSHQHNIIEKKYLNWNWIGKPAK